MRAIQKTLALVERCLLAFVMAVGVVHCAQADNFSIDDFSLGFGDFKLRAKRLEVVDAPLNQAQFTDFLKTINSDNFHTVFPKLKIGRLTLSNVVVESVFARVKTVTVYKKFIVEGLEDGKAQSLSLVESVSAIEGAQNGATSLIGAYEAKNFDFIASIDSLVRAANEQSEPVSRLLASRAEARDISIVQNSSSAVSIGRMEISNVYARSLSSSLDGLIALTPKEENSSATPEQMAALRLAGLDILNAYRFDSLAFANIRVGPPGRADAPAPPARFSVDAIHLEAYRDGTIQRFTIEGAAELGDPPSRLGRLAFTHLDLKPWIEAFGDRSSHWAPPHFSNFEMEQLTGKDFALKSLRIEGRGWRALAPDYLNLMLEGWENKAPPFLLTPANKEKIINAEIRAAYAEPDRNWKFSQYRFEVMGFYQLSGALELDNVDKSLFDGQPENFKSALAAIQLSRLTLQYDDFGLLDKYAALEDPAMTRAKMAQTAPAIVTSLFGSTAKAQKLAKAVTELCQGGKSLRVDLFAPGRVGLIDLWGSGRFHDLFEQFEIDVKND